MKAKYNSPCNSADSPPDSSGKQAEEALQLFASLFRQSAIPTALVSFDNGKFIDVNNALLKTFGYSRDEVIGKTTAQLGLYVNLEQREQIVKELMTTGSVSGPELLLRKKDGGILNCSFSTELVESQGKQHILGMMIDSTELKRAEEKHRVILETALDGFYIVDLEARFLEVNDSYSSMVGYTREELLMMSIPDIEAEETPEETAQHIKKVMEQGYGRFETRHRCKDGKIIDIEVSSNYVDVEGGQMVTFVRDITERKRAEQTLRESEEKYRTLAENIPQRIFFKDKNSVYLSCNDNYAQDLNMKPEDISGHTDYDFYPRELAEEYRAQDQRVLESGTTEGVEERYIHHGQERVVETFKTPVRDESGQLVGILGIFHDITERKHTEDRLVEYKTAVEQSVDGIAVVDMGGYIRFVNEALARMHGYSVQELVGQHSSVFHTQTQLESEVNPFCQRLRKTGSNAGEVWHVTKNGQAFLAWMTTTVLKGADQKPFGLLAIMRDITEQKQMERQRRDQEIAEARAEELSKSRRRLISAQESLRKEIASQLHGTVQSRLILLEQKLAELEAKPASERTTEELSGIRQKLEELRNNHIRPISHRLFPYVLRMGLAAGLESLVDEYGTKLHIDLQVSKRLRDEEQANRRFIPDNVKLALYRIAEEALVNIVKHTHPGANIVVKLSPSNSGALRLTVSDDGGGFDTSNSSNGIGLTIISDYAAAAGGSCAIKSVPGKGTRVTAQVPLAVLKAQQSAGDYATGAPCLPPCEDFRNARAALTRMLISDSPESPRR